MDKKELTSRLASEQLALKMKLEQGLLRQMKSYYNQIAQLNRAIYTETGQTLDVSEFDMELQGVLLAHYRKVGRSIGTNLRRQINKAAPDFFEKKQIDEQITLALTEAFRRWADESTLKISESTQRALDDTFSDAQAQAVAAALQGEEETIIDNAAIAIEGTKAFKNRVKSRPQTTATTETQKAFEGSKQIEMEVVIAEVENITGESAQEVIETEWVAVLDQNTRQAHVIADGQRRPLNEPFIVGGERLLYPGDTSLGATAKNVINCRCIAAQIINDAPLLEAIDSRIAPGTRREPVGIVLQDQ